MSEMIFQEAHFFMASLVMGILLVFGYDWIRIIRRTIPHGKVGVTIEDLLFWVIGSILVFGMIYEKNHGIIRGTAFLSVGLGMYLYHRIVSKMVIKIGYGIFGKPIRKVLVFLSKGLKKIRKTVKLKVETKE